MATPNRTQAALISGVKEVVDDAAVLQVFEALQDPKLQARIASASLAAGLKLLADAGRANVPSALTEGHSGDRFRQAIGQRLGRFKGGGKSVFAAKAGLNVGRRAVDKDLSALIGKRRKVGAAAPHAALYALGTSERKQKRGRRTGHMTSNPWFARATAQVSGQAIEAIKNRFVIEVEKAVKKQAKANASS